METQIRILLLILGVIILFGVVIDFLRRKPKVTQENIDYSDIPESLPESEGVIEPLYYNLQAQDPNMGPYFDVNLDPVVDLEAPEPEIIQTKPAPKDISNMLTLSIMAREKRGFNGADLHAALTNAGMHFGRNDIFHRHENEDGSGKVLFSVVKAVEPGYFYINLLNREHVPGITFILLPDEVINPIFAFDKMIRAAKQLAFTLNGELLDDKRKALTLSMIDQYRAQLQANANR